MFELMVLEVVSFVGAIVSSYLCWGPLSSREMVEYFGPPVKTDEKLSADALYERRRWAGFHAEVLRAFMITIFGLIAVPFYLATSNILSILQDPTFQLFFAVLTVIIFSWSIYWGPRFFALKYCGNFKFFSRTHFRKFVRPYWGWILYPVLVWAGIGLTTLMMIVSSISVDIGQLQLYRTEITAIQFDTIEHVQFSIIRLNDFGNWISLTSQKYMLTTILIFIYVIVEQRSSMRYTILDNSVERLKYVVWTGFLFTVGFSLIILPLQYEDLHSLIRNNVELLTQNHVILSDKYGDVISIQERLEDQDLRWLLLHIITGYGNLFTISIVSLCIFLWKLFFNNVPLKHVLALLIPAYITTKLNKLSENFYFDMNVQNGAIERSTTLSNRKTE